MGILFLIFILMAAVAFLTFGFTQVSDLCVLSRVLLFPTTPFYDNFPHPSSGFFNLRRFAVNLLFDITVVAFNPG
jgi:hypothetical protein